MSIIILPYVVPAVNSGSSYVFTFTLHAEYGKGNSVRFTLPDVNFILNDYFKGLFI